MPVWLALALAAMTGMGFAAGAAEPHFAPLPSKAIGVLVPNADGVLEQEGRSGPADAALFSLDNASYRWILLPALPGEKGEPFTLEAGSSTPKVFENVQLATQSLIAARGLPRDFSLVEVEVNGGFGSPAIDRFVATRLRRIDGTAKMPVSLPQAITSALAKCREQWPQAEAEAMFESARRSALGAEAPALREERTVPHVTWLSSTRQVQVTCIVRITGREGKTGIGITPNLPRDLPQLQYGKAYDVRWTGKYLVSPDGQITSVPSTGLETSFSELPPPSGARPKR